MNQQNTIVMCIFVNSQKDRYADFGIADTFTTQVFRSSLIRSTATASRQTETATDNPL